MFSVEEVPPPTDWSRVYIRDAVMPPGQPGWFICCPSVILNQTGIYLHRDLVWRNKAVLRHDGVSIFSGYYATEEEAKETLRRFREEFEEPVPIIVMGSTNA